MEPTKPKLNMNKDTKILHQYNNEELAQNKVDFDGLLDLKTIEADSIITKLEQKMQEREQALGKQFKR